MSKKFPPGWYPTPEGLIERWDGKNWTGETQPPAPTGGEVGWHLESDGLYHWWLGDHWSPARATADDRVDVLNCVGQALLDHLAVFGGPFAEPVDALRKDLLEYPPSRVESMTSHPSPLIKGTQLVTVISWVGPQS